MNNMQDLGHAMDVEFGDVGVVKADQLPPPSYPPSPKRQRVEDDNKYDDDPSEDHAPSEHGGAEDGPDDPDNKPITKNLFTGKDLFDLENADAEYEESTDWSVTEAKGSYSLVGPDHVPRKCFSALEVLEHLLSGCGDKTTRTELLGSIKAEFGQGELEATLLSPVQSFTHVKKSDVKKLKAGKALTVAQQKAKKALDALKAYRSRDVVHGYGNLKKHPSEFLEEYGALLWDYDEWLANQAVSFDFEARQAEVTQASSVADIEAELKRNLSDHGKTQMESLKGAYFIGRCVNFLRAKGATTWLDVCKRLGVGKTTLGGKERLFLFLNEFRLFLRVPLPYTTLLRYSKDLVKHFDGNHEAAAKWRDLKWGVPDASR